MLGFKYNVHAQDIARFYYFLKTKDFGHDFKTAEPLLHGQRVDGGVEFAIKNIA